MEVGPSISQKWARESYRQQSISQLWWIDHEKFVRCNEMIWSASDRNVGEDYKYNSHAVILQKRIRLEASSLLDTHSEIHPEPRPSSNLPLTQLVPGTTSSAHQ